MKVGLEKTLSVLSSDRGLNAILEYLLGFGVDVGQTQSCRLLSHVIRFCAAGFTNASTNGNSLNCGGVQARWTKRKFVNQRRSR